jgi:hypothetical protein
MPTIIMKGRVAGTWNRTLGKKAVFLSPTPFTSPTKVEKRAFAAAAQRHGQFLGMPVEL